MKRSLTASTDFQRIAKEKEGLKTVSFWVLIVPRKKNEVEAKLLVISCSEVVDKQKLKE